MEHESHKNHSSPPDHSGHSPSESGAHGHDCCGGGGDMDHTAPGSHGNHSAGWASHGSAADFLRRFWTVTVLLVPLVLLMSPVIKFLNFPDFLARPYISFAIATVIFYFSLVFFEHASHEIKARKYGMMTLVSIAVGAGYAFSVASTFLPALKTEFYVEISTLIWVLLFGHYLEAKSSAAAGSAVAEVAKLLPRTAHRLESGQTKDVDITELREGDIVLVKPGEKIPADGLVKSGESNMDESLISGESRPVRRAINDKVVAGSIALDGSLEVSLTGVGENSTIKQIERLISEAQKTKPTTQRIADRAAGILTAVAVLTALATILVWTLVVGETLVFAITLAITVLVIACPHALGLAIPTVTTIGTSLAVKNGVFIKNLAKVETIRAADYVIFDKTGTLTLGQFGVTDIIAQSGDDRDLLTLAASLDSHSAHVISQAITSRATDQKLSLKTVTGFKNVSGRGITGTIEGQAYFLGNLALVKDNELELDASLNKKYLELSAAGKTVIFLGVSSCTSVSSVIPEGGAGKGERESSHSSGQVLGLLALADQIRPESRQVVADLHALGVKAAMLTGDNEQVAADVAAQLNMDTFFAEVRPEDKYKYIKQLQEEGNKVIMVGDGVNDAPALTQADAGIAIGAGTDVAVEAGDVVLTRSNPADVVRLVVLSRKIYSKMVQNLVWALGYNIVAIPAAAGVFAYWGFFLRPEIGALLMSLSSVIVVLNALTLKRLKL